MFTHGDNFVVGAVSETAVCFREILQGRFEVQVSSIKHLQVWKDLDIRTEGKNPQPCCEMDRAGLLSTRRT